MLGIISKQKHQTAYKALFVTVSFGLLGGLMFMKFAAAAGGSIYLSPNGYSVVNGGTFTVNIRVNPGATVDSVQGTLNYSDSKLDVVSVNTGGSAFSAELKNSRSAGAIMFGRGDFGGGTSADAFVESVTFKAKVGSGSDSLYLTNAYAANNGTKIDSVVAGATVAFVTPACPAGQTGTPPNCVTPAPPKTGTGGGSGSTGSGSSGSGSGSTSGSSTKPGTSSGTPASGTPKPNTGSTGTTDTKGTDKPSEPATQPDTDTPENTESTIRVTPADKQFTTFSVLATTQKPTKVYIKYGLAGQLANQTDVSDFSTTHTIGLDSKLLTPGETYSYIVVSTDESGQVTESEPQTVTMKGLTVKVRVLDANRQPIRNQKVTLHSKPITGTTDGDGVVTFANATPGDHSVIYVAGKTSYQQKIKVSNNVVANGATQTAVPQSFSIAYAYTHTANPVVVVAPVTIVLLVAVALVVLQKRGVIHLQVPERLSSLLPERPEQVVATGPLPVISVAPTPTEQMVQPTIQMPSQPVGDAVPPVVTEPVASQATHTTAPPAAVVPVIPPAQPDASSTPSQTVVTPPVIQPDERLSQVPWWYQVSSQMMILGSVKFAMASSRKRSKLVLYIAAWHTGHMSGWCPFASGDWSMHGPGDGLRHGYVQRHRADERYVPRLEPYVRA